MNKKISIENIDMSCLDILRHIGFKGKCSDLKTGLFSSFNNVNIFVIIRFKKM